MNCKLGDLAIIIKSDFPENIGGWVHVEQEGEYVGEWGCKLLQPMRACDLVLNIHITVPAGTLCGVEDSALQPIRGQRSANPDPVHALIGELANA
jgi:hypothetical protein